MKVVHLVTVYDGGAAKAAARLNEALNNCGVDSYLLTTNYSNKKNKVLSVYNNKLSIMLYKIKNKINQLIIGMFKPKDYFSCDFFGVSLIRNKYIKNADIIHLHWVNNGMITYKTLKRLTSLNKKIVWTMHDMNSFTGGCHYSWTCNNYKDNCKKCPYLKGNLANYIYNVKNKSIENLNVTIIGCSKWITECARNSSILSGKKCINVPNCVNMDTFKVMDKSIARKEMGIIDDKKIVLFGAMSSTSDKRKGYIQLKQALALLPSNEYKCYIFGSDQIEELPIEAETLGIINDEKKLALAYNSADVFVAPSLQENLSNTVVESISCGTPVVAFNIGGMPDMIHNEETGYLAKYMDSNDLAKGIMECATKTGQMQQKCRKYAEGHYSYEIVSKQINDIYSEILED